MYSIPYGSTQQSLSTNMQFAKTPFSADPSRPFPTMSLAHSTLSRQPKVTRGSPQLFRLAALGIHYRVVQLEGGAVDGGSTI